MRLALAGDTMLGRRVAHAIRTDGVGSLIAPEVIAVARESDLFVLNLECCISERGERWPEPDKPFFFRAPPAATELLQRLLFLADLDRGGMARLEAVPLKLDFCHTRLADGEDAAWIRSRFRNACSALGTPVATDGCHLVAEFRA